MEVWKFSKDEGIVTDRIRVDCKDSLFCAHFLYLHAAWPESVITASKLCEAVKVLSEMHKSCMNNESLTVPSLRKVSPSKVDSKLLSFHILLSQVSKLVHDSMQKSTKQSSPPPPPSANPESKLFFSKLPWLQLKNFQTHFTSCYHLNAFSGD